MKLNLEYLAPYLPYGLKMIFDGKGGRVITLTGITDVPNLGIAITNGNGSMWLNSCGFMPILRPLSDLDEEIEFNGNSFVPIDWLEDKYYTQSFHKECERFLEEDGFNWINQSSYLLIIHLLEWHFDVFGLIDSGLAIDMNTLKAAV